MFLNLTFNEMTKKFIYLFIYILFFIKLLIYLLYIYLFVNLLIYNWKKKKIYSFYPYYYKKLKPTKKKNIYPLFQYWNICTHFFDLNKL